MAKTITKYAEVSLQKNLEKGGAWLGHFTIKSEGGELETIYVQAFSNPSAGKRWAKEHAVNATGRKSIKWVIKTADANNKPVHLIGEYGFKVRND